MTMKNTATKGVTLSCNTQWQNNIGKEEA